MHLNPENWVYKQVEASAETQIEYEFKLVDATVYGMLITENTSGSLKDFVAAAFEQTRASMPDATVVTEELRTVNGLTVVYREIEGSINGVALRYLAYYYASSAGVAQLVVYAEAQKLAFYPVYAQNLLNGLAAKDE